MLVLSFVWLLLGVLIGSLAMVARLPMPKWGRSSWAILLLIGAAAGLVGGWLGTLVYGRFFGTATATWVAVLAVVLIPWVAKRQSN